MTMKSVETVPVARPLAASVLLMLTSAAMPASHGQGWETIVSIGDPQLFFYGDAILLDPFSESADLPGLFIGGHSAYGQVLHVNQATQPATITTADGALGDVNRLATDAFGNLYSAAKQVRKSSDGGALWSVVDEGGVDARGLATDPQGNVFVSGTLTDRQGKQFWVIRKGGNLGQNWSVCYKSGKPLAQGMGIVFVEPVPGGHAGGLFAAGTLTAIRTTQWSVLRSRDSGATWQWVDAWGPSKGNGGAYARAITADGAGNIYVAGYDVMGVPAWYVRRSLDGGVTWQTILSEYTDGDYNRADDIAADPWGNVHVAGLTKPAGGSAQWTIRRWDAATQSWDQWPDELRHPLSSWASVSTARGIVSDAFGRVYATGSADGLWIVQRLGLP